VTREVWNKVREAIVDVLESENLAGLVERYRGKIA
jgi:DNA-binding IscR family transcriptional regulator